MSGIVAYFERTASLADPEHLECGLRAIRHRGPHGAATVHHGRTALGHLHFWTTPEEVGEAQPVVEEETGRMLAFDGRLDNRDELLGALDSYDLAVRGTSDALLVLRAYSRWGEDCVRHLLGPFAFVLFDPAPVRLLLARDALGDRSLHYALDQHRCVAASEESAVLACPGVGCAFDEVALLHHFAMRTPPPGVTYYRWVRELPPGHVLTVDPQGAHLDRYWALDGARRIVYGSDDDYASRYLELLTDSVRCRLRGNAPPAIAMSGGLDSTAVAALAASAPGLASPSDVRTISYVFDELPTCDEREFIRELAASSGTTATYIAADDAWPLRDEAGSGSRNRPDWQAYRALVRRVYDTAAGLGRSVLLTGTCGDELYAGAEEWLADLLAERRVSHAVRELSEHVAHHGPVSVLTSHSMRRLVARAVVPGRTVSERPPRLPWLKPTAAAAVAEMAAAGVTSARRPRQADEVLDHWAASGIASEQGVASRFSVEWRYPYRDRRLVEFMLAVPAHQLYNRGDLKYVHRQAMRGILPESIRTRARPTSLMPLFRRGLAERERERLDSLIRAPDALWRDYVRPEWVERAMEDLVGPRRAYSDTTNVLLWQCASAEAWRLGPAGHEAHRC